MEKFIIKGGKKLNGEVKVGGSKNAALPIMCASLLSRQKVTLKNVPDISDVHAMLRIFEALGAKTSFDRGVVEIDASNLKNRHIPDEYVCKMRASILVLGSLLPRFGEVKMAFPGGCVLGKRSVSAHTAAFKQLGYEVKEETTALHIKSGKKSAPKSSPKGVLKFTKVVLPELSVTATENAITAAVLAPGTTEIRLAAAEPHVQDLCRFLNKLGAKISGIGTNNLTITGVKSLKGGSFTVTGDYLQAGTFAIAAVATKGTVKVRGIDPGQLDILWQKFKEMGVNFELGKDFIRINPTPKLAPTNIQTAVYPGFPTDLQAPFTVLLTQAKGFSKVFETLFEGRLNYLFELEKMGARLELLNPHQALLAGPAKLKGIPIASIDIRAGAAMVVAALIAKGTTEISNIGYIDRGYEHIEQNLRQLGADITRIHKD